MTILIDFHVSSYLRYVLAHLRPEFPGLVSFSHFVVLTPAVLTLLCS